MDAKSLLIVLLCFMGSMLDGFDLQSIGFLAPIISKAFHISVASFGTVFSAGLLGLGIGSMLIGQVADTVGRHRTLIIVLFYIAILSLLTAMTKTREQLVFMRFLTSLGLGGALPVLSALTAEHAPRRFQKIALCLLFATVPAGGLMAGLVADRVLPIWGWPSVFVIGGILPMVLGVVFSIAIRGQDRRFSEMPRDAVASRPASSASLWFMSLQALFEMAEWRVTLPLWAAYFSCLLVLYFMVNWIPALLTQASLPPSLGIWAISTFSFGGILGTVFQGPLLTRFGPSKPVLVAFAVAAALIICLGSVKLTTASVTALAFAIGWAIQGAQSGLNTFTATHYRIDARATAMGWALAIGRLGAIAGAIIGGIALQAGISPRVILLATSVPVVVGTLAFALATVRQSFEKLSLSSRRGEVENE